MRVVYNKTCELGINVLYQHVEYNLMARAELNDFPHASVNCCNICQTRETMRVSRAGRGARSSQGTTNTFHANFCYVGMLLIFTSAPLISKLAK